MLYLAEKYDTDRKISYAPGTPEYIEQLSWLMFQMGGVGPMQGMLPPPRQPRPYPETQLTMKFKAKQTTSASSPAHAPTTVSSGTSTRQSVSTPSSSPDCKKALTSPARSIPFRYSELLVGA